MIQDIFPHKWDIAYYPKEPKADSFILFFYQDQLLVIKEAAEEQHLPKIIYPVYAKVKHWVRNATYLFSLDEKEMFRVEILDESTKQELEASIPGSSFEGRRFFRTAAPKEYGFAGITGLHLNGWYRKNKFCGACGKPLENDQKERMLYCPACKNMVFPRINPAVIVGVTDGSRLLLTKYRGREYKNYALVAGFTEIGESFEETVAREVLEETGLTVKNVRYYKSQPWAFADDILAGYFCEVEGNAEITMDPGELSVAEWVEREDIEVEYDDTSLTNEMICYFKYGKGTLR